MTLIFKYLPGSMIPLLGLTRNSLGFVQSLRFFRATANFFQVTGSSQPSEGIDTENGTDLLDLFLNIISRKFVKPVVYTFLMHQKK